jgi:hypothetical protein
MVRPRHRCPGCRFCPCTKMTSQRSARIAGGVIGTQAPVARQALRCRPDGLRNIFRKAISLRIQYVQILHILLWTEKYTKPATTTSTPSSPSATGCRCGPTTLAEAQHMHGRQQPVHVTWDPTSFWRGAHAEVGRQGSARPLPEALLAGETLGSGSNTRCSQAQAAVREAPRADC